jgi:hypothetical protein
MSGALGLDERYKINSPGLTLLQKFMMRPVMAAMRRRSVVQPRQSAKLLAANRWCQNITAFRSWHEGH